MKHDQHLTWPEILWLFHRCEDPGPWLLTLPLARIRACADCRERCGELLEMLREGEIGETLDYLDLVLLRSRRRAKRVWSRLQDADLKWMARALARAPALWGLVEILIEESRAAASVDRDQALALAQMAVAMADRLPTRPPGDETLVGPNDEEPLSLSARAEALALAYAVLGNAYRVRDAIPRAKKQFDIADGYLLDIREGSLFQGRALVLSLKGSFLTDTRQLRQAAESLEDALAAAREEARDTALIAGITIKLSTVLGLLGESEAAVGMIASFLRRPEEPSLPPRYRHFLRNQLAVELVRAGSPQRAEDLLPEIHRFASEDDLRLHQSRIRWLEGRIALATGNATAALDIFQRLQRDYLERGCVFEAALLAFEIALAHHQLGDDTGVLRTAETALSLLIPLGVAPEALGALTLLARHAHRHKVRAETLVALIRWAEGGPDGLPVELGDVE